MEPDLLRLLASLAALNVQGIASWLVTDLNPDYTPQRLGTLQNLALIQISEKPPFVQMHSLVQAAVISSLSKSEWTSHLRRTVLDLCHLFMDVSSNSSKAVDFYTNAKAISRHLDAIRGDQGLIALLSEDLDTFARFIQGLGGIRQHVQYVVQVIAGGDLDALDDMIQYVSRRRGGPDSPGSQPMYWYMGRKPSTKDYRYTYMYD